jgi:ribosomal protein S18 acetylase RimI-like enzyme
MEQVVISKASISDLESVKRIGRETFFETFAESNTEADMKRYLDQNFSDSKLTGELSNPDSHFFIAWDGEVAIGYLKLNTGKAQSELQDAGSIEIERIYVKQAYHGKKVGQLLYEKALEIARQMNKEVIWLGVWEENPKAIRFYEKNGFTAFGTHQFMLGKDEQTDILMKRAVV